MKQLIVIFVIATILVGGASVIGLGPHAKTANKTTFLTTGTTDVIYDTVQFSAPHIDKNNGYLSIGMDDCAALRLSGSPVLPVRHSGFTFPLGTRIVDIKVHTTGMKEQTLDLQVQPAYNAVAPDMSNSPLIQEADPEIYGADVFFPDGWYAYDTAGGIKDGARVTLVSISLYPARYNPAQNILQTVESADISILYELPAEPLTTADSYDLLIVCPGAWESLLDPLVEHKESKGIATKVACLECIAAGEYFPAQGRDDAEQLKYFIKNAIEEWGIQYVLLVGGRKPGIQEDWLLPVRYVHVFWADEYRYISDLYYADIYDSNGSFSSWDTDNNDVFMEWPNLGKLQDEVDLYPDIYIGRWACRSKIEVNIMVDKTITYENMQISQNVVLAGGDNFPQDGVEGEIVCDKVLEYLPGFDADKVYVTLGDVTSDAMKAGLNDGAMFIHLHGHGSPIYWSTHKEGDTGGEWEDGLKYYDLPLFFNDEYSISIIGGCHTAMFNMSLTVYPWAGVPAPGGTAWWFARKYDGGGIASLGYTAFPVATPGEAGDLDGNGINDPDCAESGYGFMQEELIYGYGMAGLEHLGECWHYAVTSYTEHFKIPEERYHFHTIQSFVLLGDPTLKIGGY